MYFDCWTDSTPELERFGNTIQSRYQKIFKEEESMLIVIPKKYYFKILQKNLFELTMFRPNLIDVSTEASLQVLLELFENVDNPQMIKINMGLSLWEKRDSNLTLLNYINYIKYINFSYLELYNKIVETSIRRQIKCEFIKWFLFIQEISKLNEIKFIHSILFPWNKNYDAESMINLWKEFLDSSQFEYREVVLI